MKTEEQSKNEILSLVAEYYKNFKVKKINSETVTKSFMHRGFLMMGR